MSEKNKILGFAIWQPRRGLHQPYHHEGALVYVRSDDEGILNDVREMNRVRKMNRTSGQIDCNIWRIIPVDVVLRNDPPLCGVR